MEETLDALTCRCRLQFQLLWCLPHPRIHIFNTRPCERQPEFPHMNTIRERRTGFQGRKQEITGWPFGKIINEIYACANQWGTRVTFQHAPQMLKMTRLLLRSQKEGDKDKDKDKASPRIQAGHQREIDVIACERQ